MPPGVRFSGRHGAGTVFDVGRTPRVPGRVGSGSPGYGPDTARDAARDAVRIGAGKTPEPGIRLPRPDVRAPGGRRARSRSCRHGPVPAVPRGGVRGSPGRCAGRLRARRRRSPCEASYAPTAPLVTPPRLSAPGTPVCRASPRCVRGERSNGPGRHSPSIMALALTRRPLFASIGDHACAPVRLQPASYLTASATSRSPTRPLSRKARGFLLGHTQVRRFRRRRRLTK